MRYFSALLVMVLANGCFFLPSWGGWGSEDEWTSYDEVHEIDGHVEGAWLGGDMVDIGNFEGDAYQVDYYGGYGSSSVTMHAGSDGGDDFGWAMLALSTADPDGFEGETFEPGASLDSDSGQLDAQGCTGPSHGDWNFDGHAQRIEVQVEDGPQPGSRLIHFQAYFEGQGMTEGSFVLLIDTPTDPGTGVVDG
ncbi:MAG: hypothetical protein KC619_29680 [Myxococcales bacterium]|nr:hypothetical protein [Myxococcales bacterium]